MTSRVLVRLPATYQAERRYVSDEVFRRMLGFDVTVEIDPWGLSTVVSVAGSGKQLILEDGLFGSPPEDWLSPASIPTLPVPIWRSPPGAVHGAREDVPVLFGRPASGDDWTTEADGALVCGADLLGGVFFLLSGYEEIVSDDRDEHGRFLAGASLLGPNGLADIPLADAYGEVLRGLMRRLWPALQGTARSYRLRLTCDVDHAFGIHGRNPRQIVRRAASDLRRHKSPGLAISRLAPWPLVAAGKLDHDPHNNFDFLMSVAEAHDVQMTFYFPAGLSRHARDALHPPTYPPIVSLLGRINRRGHLIGLHPSYSSAGSVEMVKRELTVLQAACEAAGVDQPVFGGRQHYLRWEPATWRLYEEVGLTDDSSMGFPDRPGFRAGAAGEFRAFDVEHGRVLDVMERPLHLMDVTVLGYEARDEQALADRAEQLSQTIRGFGGTMTLLWHNDQLVSRRQKRFLQVAVEAAS